MTQTTLPFSPSPGTDTWAREHPRCEAAILLAVIEGDMIHGVVSSSGTGVWGMRSGSPQDEKGHSQVGLKKRCMVKKNCPKVFHLGSGFPMLSLKQVRFRICGMVDVIGLVV